jgi:signal transduction histidine kinase
MKGTFFYSFYGRISLVFLLLLLLLGFIQVVISVNSSMNFVRESEQKLNRNLARDLAKEFEPFTQDSLDAHGLEHKIHELMVMNPRVEFYVLDSDGTILGFFAEPRKKVKKESVDLGPILRFLADKEDLPIWGDDPRKIEGRKPFSASRIKIGPSETGYLYVILGSEQYESAASLIRNSYIERITAISIVLTVLFTAIIGLILFRLLTRRFHHMTDVVEKFRKGDLRSRIRMTSRDEIGQLANSFDEMADTIVAVMGKLERTDRMRRELVANVSHDLRTPLASMQGYLETILMKDPDIQPEERKRFLKTIYDDTVSLNSLVDELFELSKLDAKEIEPTLEPCNIAELTQDIVIKFRPLAEKLGVNLETSIPKDALLVEADIALLERALSNLIDNALKYTPEGGSATVGLESAAERIRIRVSDTGPGIPAEDLPFIFDRFYRGKSRKSRSGVGTGLGLAIASRILELHRSTISVDSAEDSGTTMSFELAMTST